MSDYDADQIRNRKLMDDIKGLAPHLPRLLALAEAIDGAPRADAQSQPTDEVAHLQDRLRDLVADAERIVETVKASAASYEAAKTEVDGMIASLKANVSRTKAPDPVVADQVAAENAETLKDVAARTERRSDEEIQKIAAKRQALVDGGTPSAEVAALTDDEVLQCPDHQSNG